MTLSLLREASPTGSSLAAAGSFPMRGVAVVLIGQGGAKRRDLERGTLSSELELPEAAILAATVEAMVSFPGGASVPKRSPTDWLSGIGTALREKK